MNIPILFPAEDRNTNLLFSDAELHSHFYWEFTTFTSGVCKNIINGKEYTVSEGHLVILGPAHSHSIIASTPTHTHRDTFISTTDLHRICIELFDEDFFQQLCDPDTPIVYKLSSHFAKQLEHSFSILDAAYVQQQSAETLNSIIHSIIIFLLGQVYMASKIIHQSNVSWLSAQLTYLHQPEVFRLNIDDVINPTGYSHSQYLRKFKQSTGATLIQYLIHLRITHAKMLLTSTAKSVLEISTEVGYDSVNYFIRVFKTYTGVTPLQFRLQNNK